MGKTNQSRFCRAIRDVSAAHPSLSHCNVARILVSRRRMVAVIYHAGIGKRPVSSDGSHNPRRLPAQSPGRRAAGPIVGCVPFAGAVPQIPAANSPLSRPWACSHSVGVLRCVPMRMAARSEARTMADPLAGPSDKADAALEHNPKGRVDLGRTAVLLPPYVEPPHRVDRALPSA